MFQVGEMVVCVIGYPQRLTEGWIYTVKEVEVPDYGSVINETPNVPRNGISIRVNEALSPLEHLGHSWWKSTRFRKLTKADLSRLTQKHKIKEPQS